MAFNVFLDTNIFIDHFQGRDAHSTSLIKSCEEGLVNGFASAASFYTLVYVMRKTNVLDIKRLLGGYLHFISVLPTVKSTLRGSLDASFYDLEDAFQYFTALQEEKLDFFITNNLKDFQKVSQQLPVISPKKFISEHLK